MYNDYKAFPNPYYVNSPMFNPPHMYNIYNWFLYNYYINAQMFDSNFSRQFTEIKDYGPEPFVVNIDEATMQNNTFRTALWTGENLQVTLMSIDVDDDIGLEVHPTVDQFIRIEEGQGLVQIGDSNDKLDFEEEIYDDYAIMIPAGKWHNLINTGDTPLKLYTIYAPPEHPHGTIHETKSDAEADEHNYLN